jgi:hypothetical protein
LCPGFARRRSLEERRACECRFAVIIPKTRSDPPSISFERLSETRGADTGIRPIVSIISAMPSLKPMTRLLEPEQIAPEVRQRADQRAGFEDEYPFESHWFEVDGRTLHYVDEGHGPVLLMVHGNPTWSFAWRRLVKDLSRDFRVIAIDHLGCGFSEKPQDRDVYTLDGHIRRLMTLVSLLDLRQITLFAHDWGGAIGMGCAGRTAERFQRFVLMNTGAFRSQAIPFRISLCRIPLLWETGRSRPESVCPVPH